MSWHRSKPYKSDTGPMGGVSLGGVFEEEHGRALNVQLSMGVPPNVMWTVQVKGVRVNVRLNIERARILARMLIAPEEGEIGRLQLGGWGEGDTGNWLDVHRITGRESVGPYLSLNIGRGGFSISTQLSEKQACEFAFVLLEACEEADLMTRDYAADVEALAKQGGAK